MKHEHLLWLILSPFFLPSILSFFLPFFLSFFLFSNLSRQEEFGLEHSDVISGKEKLERHGTHTHTYFL